MMRSRLPLGPLALGLSLLAGVGCREGAAKADANPELVPACVSYLEQAAACSAANRDEAKHAVDAVYAANKQAIDGADTSDKMSAMVKQCEKWSALLAENPRCN